MKTDKPVCVTGASGFIAAHIVRELLERGYRVRGTVRSLRHPDKYTFLTQLPGAAERLTLVEADLLAKKIDLMLQVFQLQTGFMVSASARF